MFALVQFISQSESILLVIGNIQLNSKNKMRKNKTTTAEKIRTTTTGDDDNTRKEEGDDTTMTVTVTLNQSINPISKL